MRKGLLVALVVLAVLLGAGWLADNAVRRTAQDRAAAALQARLGLDEEPEVSIGGFPFSLALLTRSVPQASASVRRVVVGASGHEVTVTGVRAETGAITLAGTEVVVDRVDAIGVLDYGGLSELAGVPVSFAGDGRLALTCVTTIAGTQVSVGITALPELDEDGGRLRLTDPRLLPDAKPPFPVSRAQLKRLARPIPIRLPEGVRLTALSPSQGGVAVAGRATGVRLPVA